MKRSTIKLLATAGAVYVGFLILIRGLLPQDFAPSVPLLVIPLVVLILVLIKDLKARATLPVVESSPKTSGRLIGRKVQFLTRQIEVASEASPTFFETILLNRLRELLVVKVSLETGVDIDKVRQTLDNRSLATSLIKDDFLLSLLYSPSIARGQARLEMLRESIARIEAWKA